MSNSGMAKRLSLLFVTATISLTATVSHALPVLTIDVSDPSAVVIAATGEFSMIDDTNLMISGVTIEGFFAADFILDDTALSNTGLSTPGGLEYTHIVNDPVLVPLSARDINLYALFSTVLDIQDFSTSKAAFVGQFVTDLFKDAPLPAIGASGNVFVGDGNFINDRQRVIGTWQAVGSIAPTSVPEPGTAALLLSGMGLIVFGRLRRRQCRLRTR